MEKRANVVVMGGSFNPPTIVHLKTVQAVMDALDAKKGYLVPVSFAYLKRKMIRAECGPPMALTGSAPPRSGSICSTRTPWPPCCIRRCCPCAGSWKKRIFRRRFFPSGMNTPFSEMLLNTGDVLLINGGKGKKDTYWGVNTVTWEGENRLGILLMELRK